MLNSRMVQFDKAVRLRKESTEAMIDYWKDYSIYTSFEFWILTAMLIVPLFILIWKIDKGKIFLICFFGYSVHMISFYISLLGVNMGMWNYPIQLVPLLPSFSLDSSIVPVTFMLAYQWALNKKKNYYIVALAVSIFFSFIFEPILVKMEIFKLYNHITYLHRFILYIVISLVAKFMSNVFLWIQKRGNMST